MGSSPFPHPARRGACDPGHVEWRQAVVDVLCASLRVRFPPMDPARGWAATLGYFRERAFRVAVQRVLARHLRPEEGQAFWADIDLDLTEAALIGFDLAGCAVRAGEFSEATFRGGADFTGVAFAGDVCFHGAEFPGDVRFSGATFTGKADFDYAEFFGEAAFHGVAFLGEATFWVSTFKGDVGFVDAVFDGWVSFRNAMLWEDGPGRRLISAE